MRGVWFRMSSCRAWPIGAAVAGWLADLRRAAAGWLADTPLTEVFGPQHRVTDSRSARPGSPHRPVALRGCRQLGPNEPAEGLTTSIKMGIIRINGGADDALHVHQPASAIRE